ncbi:MAG: 50S ribosomal protein L10 [Candidatus Pacebacteria bacterium]|nr:50S ribosomal protein L10 [Candidatus Paceibacterota bacterium]
MAINKDRKKEIYEKAQGILKDSESVVFVNFKGLNVADTTQLRNNLRDEDSSYSVIKKSLIRKALDNFSVKGNMPELEGELALAYGKDSIAPARGVYEFQKKNQENIAILGGIFEGSFVDKEKMLSIAQIPAPQILKGQFVNLINSPIQGFVTALSKIAEKKEA